MKSNYKYPKYRNYKKYRKFVIENFQKFLNGEITNAELNSNLHTIQDDLGYGRQRIHKAVCFKFGKGDSWGCTINTIWSDLEFGDEERKNNMIVKLEFVINNPKELQINHH